MPAFQLSAAYGPKALLGFFAELGVANQVRCQFKPPSHNGHVAIRDYHSSHERGLNGFDPGFEVEGLEFAISHPTLERSKFIWNQILIPHSGRLRGEVEESSRQDFSWSRKSFHFSKAGELAFLHEWLPDREGKWHRPRGYSLSDLPDGFLPSEAVCRHFQMEFVSVSQLAEKTGIPLIERHEVFLALCPLCAAIYKEYVKRDDANSAALKTAIATTKEPLIPIKIGQQNRTLRFVEAHLFDLRVVLDDKSPPV